MNIFKKKSLCAALAGVGVLGAAGAAQAVNVNPNGLGQVLLYPYYTTRADSAGNAYNSLLSVVNTTGSVKAVKVRFLEGKNSREVLDFNLFLSPHDVWTGAITQSGAGGAQVTTTDASCTLPNFPASGTVPFVNYAYTGSKADGADTSLDRTQEGYVEIIEMATYDSASTTGVNVTHVNGVPPGCAAETDAQALADSLPPMGGLMGSMLVINVDSGKEAAQPATALANFRTTKNYQPAGSISPQLTDADPFSTVAHNSSFYFSDWSALTYNAADAVSAVLMHDAVLNEFNLDTVTNSGTDWVVTMPTKRYYVAAPATGTPAELFQRNFNGASGACDDVALTIYDREERHSTTPLNFSPPPPTQTASICWEANVITFNNTNVLGSTNVANLGTNYQNGWMTMSFAAPTSGTYHELINTATSITAQGGGTTTGNTSTYVGLPVIGFSVSNFANGGIIVNGAPALSNYSGAVDHRYQNVIN